MPHPSELAAGEWAPEPLLKLTAPLSVRIRAFVRAWILKFLVSIYYNRPLWKNTLPRGEQPTLTKSYKVDPKLTTEARVFIPQNYKSGDPPLPLLIDIHGGGWTIGYPSMDDRQNVQFSQRHGFLVVSIPYRLAPTWKFPTATHDIAAQIRAVIDDDSLPIDKSRIALIGYSAGGNLALSAIQTNKLYDEVKAIVGMYPATDMATDTEVKLRSRVSNGKADQVARMSSAFFHSYVPTGANRRDTLLSPLYAPRDKLPKSLYLVGCEYDFLCNEARQLADKLATSEIGETAVTADGAGWQKGSVRWELVKGEVHGFDQMPGKQEETMRRRKRSEKLVADIAGWLHGSVFKP